MDLNGFVPVRNFTFADLSTFRIKFLISEIDNVSSLMKDGEKILLGSNYETSEEDASGGEKDFVLKKDINKSSELVSLKKGTKKKITDQIRRKVKEMEDLQ